MCAAARSTSSAADIVAHMAAFLCRCWDVFADGGMVGEGTCLEGRPARIKDGCGCVGAVLQAAGADMTRLHSGANRFSDSPALKACWHAFRIDVDVLARYCAVQQQGHTQWLLCYMDVQQTESFRLQ